MVSLNSDKGQELMKSIVGKIYYELRDIQETIDGGNEQLVKPSVRPVERDTFYQDAQTMSYKKLIKKYNLKLRCDMSFRQRVKSKLKRLLKLDK